MVMRHKILLPMLLAGLACPTPAAYKLSVAVAPAIVQGDVGQDVSPWVGRALAEILSWEISAVQTIRVVDPATLEKNLEGWMSWTDLGQSQIEAIRAAGRQTDVEAVILPRLERRGFEATLQVAVAVYKNMNERVIRLEVAGRDDAILGLLRQQVVQSLDSLGFNVPPALRHAATQRLTKTKWDAIIEFGKGLQALSVGNREEALRRLKESQRLDPNIAAVMVRIKTLEKELAR